MNNSRFSKPRSERLMRALYDASAELTELAEQERMTLTKLAAWSNDEATIDALNGLCRLNDVRAQLLVSRYRTLAAARLFELAKDESGGEVARKSCVDLLGVSLVPALSMEDVHPDAKDEGDVEPPPIEALRMLLAEIGHEDTISSPAPVAETAHTTDEQAA